MFTPPNPPSAPLGARAHPAGLIRQGPYGPDGAHTVFEQSPVAGKGLTVCNERLGAHCTSVRSIRLRLALYHLAVKRTFKVATEADALVGR